jgi:hypothetical protein
MLRKPLQCLEAVSLVGLSLKRGKSGKVIHTANGNNTQLIENIIYV